MSLWGGLKIVPLGTTDGNAFPRIKSSFVRKMLFSDTAQLVESNAINIAL